MKKNKSTPLGYSHHTLCMQTAKALASPRSSAGSHEPSLLENAKKSRAGSFILGGV